MFPIYHIYSKPRQSLHATPKVGVTWLALPTHRSRQTSCIRSGHRRFAPYLLLRPSEEASGYQDVLFKKSLLSCKFVEMSVSGGAGGGFNARPMVPVFSFASLGSQLQVLAGRLLLLLGCC